MLYNFGAHESFIMRKLNDQIFVSVSTTTNSLETLVQATAGKTNATT